MASVKEGRLHRWNIIIVAAEVPVDLSSTLDGVCVDSDESVVRGTPPPVQHSDRAVAIPVDQNVSAEMANVKEGRLHRCNILSWLLCDSSI
uniref:Uncharacterized protein n=1 Tax=Peronospora matthiolae TaxID=2874970 RepID=A0AAV1U119_9STRA